MSDSPPSPPAENSDIPDFATPPTFADLAADPEIAPLLGFDPVFRQVKRPNGWTDDLQRELIARIAATGTLQQAVWQMGKHATGAEALYRVAAADSFRAAWDAAVAIGRRRHGLDGGSPHTGPVPGIQRRCSQSQLPPEPEPEEEEDPERSLELIGLLFAKFMLNVERERNCRLQGDVVAADFYLRQITCFEVSMDLMIGGYGMDSWEVLMRIRRDGRGVMEIGDTLMSQMLDGARREQWAKMGEPVRPEHPPERYLTDHGTYRTEDLQSLGKASTAPPGVDPGEWAQMDMSEQQRLIDEQNAANAAAQIEWETAARREYEDRRASDTSSNSRDAKRSAAPKARDGKAGFTPAEPPSPPSSTPKKRTKK